MLPAEGPWSYRMRRSVMFLSDRDATLIHQRLEPLLRPVAQVLDGYVRAARLRTGEEER